MSEDSKPVIWPYLLGLLVIVVLVLLYLILVSDDVTKARKEYKQLQQDIITLKLSQSAINTRLTNLIVLTNAALVQLFNEIASLKQSRTQQFTPYPTPTDATADEKTKYDAVNELLNNVNSIANTLDKEIDTYNISLDTAGKIVMVNGIPSITITFKDKVPSVSPGAPGPTTTSTDVVPEPPTQQVVAPDFYGQFIFGSGVRIMKNGVLVFQLSRPNDISADTIKPVTVYIPNVADGDKIVFNVENQYSPTGYAGLVGVWRWNGTDYASSINLFEELSSIDQSNESMYSTFISTYKSKFPNIGFVHAIKSDANLSATWIAKATAGRLLANDIDRNTLLVGTVYARSGVEISVTSSSGKTVVVPHIRGSYIPMQTPPVDVPFNFAFVAHSGDLVTFTNYWDAWGGQLYAQWTWQGKQYTSGRVGNFNEQGNLVTDLSDAAKAGLFDGSASYKPKPYDASKFAGSWVTSANGANCGTGPNGPYCTYTWRCP